MNIKGADQTAYMHRLVCCLHTKVMFSHDDEALIVNAAGWIVE